MHIEKVNDKFNITDIPPGMLHRLLTIIESAGHCEGCYLRSECHNDGFCREWTLPLQYALAHEREQ